MTVHAKIKSKTINFSAAKTGLTVVDIVAIIFLMQFILVIIFCFALLITAILTIGTDLLLYYFGFISKS